VALGRDSDGGTGVRRLLAGGTPGNTELTAATGVALLIVLAALGVTIVAIGPLLWEHLFIGMLLIGPLLLKLASVSYRFARYYSGDRAYREKGAPELVMRAVGPFVVLTTLAVFVSGVVLLAAGPSSRSTWYPIHKISFIVWLAVWWGHVILHGPDLITLVTTRRRERERPWDDHGAGRGARALLLLGSLVAGGVLAILTIPLFHAWTAWQQSH
jgi:hypothetical protein